MEEKKYLDKSQLLAGTEPVEVMLPCFDKPVLMRRLDMGAVTRIRTMKNIDDATANAMLIAESLVEPKMTVEEVMKMLPGHFQKLQDKFLEISGLSIPPFLAEELRSVARG